MIVCLTDKICPESPFDLICSYITANYNAKVSTDEIEATTIITDKINFVSKIKTILYICDLNFIKPQIEVFCASMYLSKLLNSTYNIKAKVQYPFVENHCMSDPKFIIYNRDCDFINQLQQELPSEQFVEYESMEDFSFGKLYIHIPECDETYNVKIPFASSYGVPTVTIDRGCIAEVASNGDIVLPRNINIKQFIQKVKVAMRDRDVNANKSKEASKKWSNLDILAQKIKDQAEKRAEKKVLQKPNELIKRTVNKKSPNVKLHQTIYSREPYIKPTSRVLPTPYWFNGHSDDNEIDVSVIVPMFRSSAEITEQIRKWDVSDDGLVKEVIYVNDGCPHNSSNFVLAAWEEKGSNLPVGKIIDLSNNSGFATACNIGAQYARGKYIIFLNADTVVTKNWIVPMVELVESENAGIIGNMILRENDIVDSAGSEWMWDNKTFEHIGRNVYQGKRISKMITLNELPEDLSIPQERDMVTGCCMLMKKELFDKTRFDVGYRIGYWEDSDINMKVKDMGYKVFFQPNSKIYHKTGHSRAHLHPFIMDNARYFYDKWVNNNRIDKLVKAKRPGVANAK